MNIIKVYDIGLAAYLRTIHGFDYAKPPEKIKYRDNNRFNFFFYMTNPYFEALKFEYLNSDYKCFDSEIKYLKKLLNKHTK